MSFLENSNIRSKSLQLDTSNCDDIIKKSHFEGTDGSLRHQKYDEPQKTGGILPILREAMVT